MEIVAPPQLRHIFPDKTHAANVWVFPNSHSPAGYATGAAVGTVVGVAVTHAWSSQQLAAALSDAADCQARALHDPLTGLPNRRAAIAEVNSRLADPDADTRGFLLALLDLDDFKTVNDTHGHPTGDDLLTVVSARLRVAVAPGDFVARLGGDEFVVLVPDHGGDPADTFTPVLAQLAQPVRIGAATLRPHACVARGYRHGRRHRLQFIRAAGDERHLDPPEALPADTSDATAALAASPAQPNHRGTAPLPAPPP